MAREYSDPGIAPLASKVVGQGVPGQVAPRAPIPTVAPDEGPINMDPAATQPSVYIPGASRHEVIHIDEGAADTVKDYPVGTGTWQSRSHGGHVPQADGPDGTSGTSKPMSHPAIATVSTSSSGEDITHA